MIEEIELQNYRPDYLDAMYSLDQECFSPEFRFDKESMRAFAEEPDAIVPVAIIASGEMIGFVIVHLEPTATKQQAYIVTLDVAKEYRRRGVAQRLLSQAEKRASAAGAQSIELHVFTGNKGAIRFYERLGYGRVSFKRRFYGGAGLDAFVYRKDF